VDQTFSDKKDTGGFRLEAMDEITRSAHDTVCTLETGQGDKVQTVESAHGQQGKVGFSDANLGHALEEVWLGWD